MRKLLIMASMFWPQRKSGGPPVSIFNLVKQIYKDFDLYIISRNHELKETEKLPGIEDGWNTFYFGKVYYFGAGENTIKNIYSVIESVNPDVIYQNSFFSYDDVFPVLWYKRRHKYVKVIIAPRGEFYPNRFRVGLVKKTVYSRFLRYSGALKDVYFQGTGEEECEQVVSILRIPKNYTYNIQNLSLVSGGCMDIEKKPHSLRICYIARIHPTKNTLKGIQLLNGVSGNVVFDIYGSIENGEYWADCEKAIAQLPDNVQVNYLGVIDHEAVGEMIAQYHAYYMPTTGENFGHSIVEAMLLGRIVLISDQTPWTSVNNAGGYAIPLRDDLAYRKALQELCDMDAAEYRRRCLNIQNYITSELDIPGTVKEYIRVFS